MFYDRTVILHLKLKTIRDNFQLGDRDRWTEILALRKSLL